MIRLPAATWTKLASMLIPQSLRGGQPLGIPSTVPTVAGGSPAVQQEGTQLQQQVKQPVVGGVSGPGIPGAIGPTGPSHTNKLPGNARMMSVIQDMGPLSTVPGQVNGNAGQGVRTGIKTAAHLRGLLRIYAVAMGDRQE